MTGGSAEKAIDRLLAAINQGKEPPREYQPDAKLGFPDLDVFTPEALDRIKALAGGDPARTARLSADVLKIAQRECAVPVLPDLVDDAAAQIDPERADSRAEGTQPYHEHSAPRTDILPIPPQDNPLPEPSAQPRHDPGSQSGGDVSAPRRMMRRTAGVLGVLLLVAGVAAGYLTHTGQLNTPGLGDTRKIVTSSFAAIGMVPPSGQQQEGRSDATGAFSAAEQRAETEPPAGSSGEAAVPDDDGEDEAPNDAVTADSPLREEKGGEEDRRADEAALEERWSELEEDADDAIKQRVREVRKQAEQARQALDAMSLQMKQLHHRQHEEMQMRHVRELALADAEGADAVAQTKDRHRQERAALQRDQKAKQDRLTAAHDELDQQLQAARRDIARAREEAAAGGEDEGGEPRAMSRLHSPEQSSDRATSSSITPPEDSTTADPVATESGLQPQSDKSDDRQQQTAATIEESGETFDEDSGADPSEQPDKESGKDAGKTPGSKTSGGETPGIAVVAPGQAESPELAQPELAQEEASEPVTAPQRAEPPGNDEEAVPLAAQPPPPSAPSSSPAGSAPGAADAAAGTAGTAASEAAEAASAAESKPATESRRTMAPDSQDVADLVNRGNALLDLGDLASARLFYRLAADRGSPEGAMRMGMTFDPVYFARTGIQGTQPQIQDALHWYDQAIAMGSEPAERRMEELRSWLERSAAVGDAQAKAALQQLR
jgi:hypothetical protein